MRLFDLNELTLLSEPPDDFGDAMLSEQPVSLGDPPDIELDELSEFRSRPGQSSPASAASRPYLVGPRKAATGGR